LLVLLSAIYSTQNHVKVSLYIQYFLNI